MNWNILNPGKMVQQLQPKPLIHLLLTCLQHTEMDGLV